MLKIHSGGVSSQQTVLTIPANQLKQLGVGSGSAGLQTILMPVGKGDVSVGGFWKVQTSDRSTVITENMHRFLKAKRCHIQVTIITVMTHHLTIMTVTSLSCQEQRDVSSI